MPLEPCTTALNTLRSRHRLQISTTAGYLLSLSTRFLPLIISSGVTQSTLCMQNLVTEQSVVQPHACTEHLTYCTLRCMWAYRLKQDNELVRALCLCAGGQSTVASASSTSSLRKQWIPAQPGASHPVGEPAEQPNADSNLALGYVPPTVALAVFVHEPIYAQYRLTSRMCMQIARNELQLLRVSQVLQDVFLGGRTTVVNAVVDSIKRQLRVHQEVRAGRLQDALQDAAAEALSAYDTPGADALHGMQFGYEKRTLRIPCLHSFPAQCGTDSTLLTLFLAKVALLPLLL